MPFGAGLFIGIVVSFIFTTAIYERFSVGIDTIKQNKKFRIEYAVYQCEKKQELDLK